MFILFYFTNYAIASLGEDANYGGELSQLATSYAAWQSRRDVTA